MLVGLADTAVAGPIYDFTFDNTNGFAGQLILQLSVEFIDVGGTQAKFVFRNDGPVPPSILSSITEIYFQDLTDVLGAFAGYADIVGTVNYNPGPGANPGHPPGVANFTPEAGSLFESSGNPSNGVNPGEQLGIVFAYGAGATAATLEQAIADQNVRFGLHVTAAGPDEEGSEGLVNTPPGTVTPEPGTLALMAMGGLGLAGGWARKRKSTATV